MGKRMMDFLRHSSTQLFKKVQSYIHKQDPSSTLTKTLTWTARDGVP